MRRNVDLEAAVVAKYVALAPLLDERARRLWAAAESRAIGYGGDALVSSATGWRGRPIRRGRQEMEQGVAREWAHSPAGCGRPSLESQQPGLTAALERLVDPLTRGDPTSPLRWTCKSQAKLTAALAKHGWEVSSTTVGRLLHELGYRLQSVRKSPERARRIPTATRSSSTSTRRPPASCGASSQSSPSTPRRRNWSATSRTAGGVAAEGHARERAGARLPDDAVGKAIPYGVYDMARNEAWVSVGRDHDTPAFAVASIRQWWKMMGKPAYPKATRRCSSRRTPAAATAIGAEPGKSNCRSSPTTPG